MSIIRSLWATGERLVQLTGAVVYHAAPRVQFFTIMHNGWQYNATANYHLKQKKELESRGTNDTHSRNADFGKALIKTELSS